MTIQTPDQRLRVFVSSTLQELAAERKAAREGIERIHLSPVMFEVAARAHPPRDLYRAYLAQSDVFVGIYGARYGWIAPGADISGIEDEYVLSAGMPRLVYVKSAPEREPRLVRMLERIEGDDLSYRFFVEPTELTELVARDLALVLTERFAAAEHAEQAALPAPPLYVPPVEHVELIGRRELTDEVALQLADAPVVTLTGPGGTGKTTLAIHLANVMADRFPDGVFYVPLAGVRDAKEVAQTLATTLEIPAPQGGADPLRLVTGFLRAKRALLVLDNFEQVIDAAPDVATLSASCRDLTILVTSRKPLRVRGEREIQVPPLPVAGEGAAVKLFEARAQAVRPSFRITDENRDAVTAICKHLDGLPLAIELAAARTRVLTPQSILPRLGQSLTFLTGGAKDFPQRHQTLRAALEWSFDLMSTPERAAFRRLGIVTGSIGLSAAEAVVGASELDPLDALASLVEQSLLVRSDVHDEPRFHMLETIREYALDRLQAAGETRDAWQRLALWAAQYTYTTAPKLSQFDTPVHYEKFVVEEPLLRSAIAWCLGPDGDLQLGWRIAASYIVILQTRMRLREVVAWHQRLTAAGPCTDEATRIRADVALGSAASATGDVHTALRCLEGAAERLRALGDRHVAGWAETTRAQTRLLLSEEGVREAVARAIEDFRSVREIHGEAYVRALEAYAAMGEGDLARARKVTTDTLDFATQHRDNDALTFLTSLLGRITLAEGDMDVARGLFANAAALGRERGGLWGRVDALMVLGSVALAQQDYTAAHGIFEEVIQAGRTVGVGFGLELAIGSLAGLAIRAGDATHAERLFRLIPDGYEDAANEIWVIESDPLGTLRGETRHARQALGPRARAAADREAIWDEVMDLALNRSATA